MVFPGWLAEQLHACQILEMNPEERPPLGSAAHGWFRRASPPLSLKPERDERAEDPLSAFVVRS